MQINTGLPLGHHWVLASASVVPVASQGTCGSSAVPVCSVQWYPSVLTKSGSEIIRSAHFPAWNPVCIQLVLVRIVWAKLISIHLQPHIHKNYIGAHISSDIQVWGSFNKVISSGVPVYPASFRRVAQWYPSVHWVSQWHSRSVLLYSAPASVHGLRVRVIISGLLEFVSVIQCSQFNSPVCSDPLVTCNSLIYVFILLDLEATKCNILNLHR